MQWAKEIGYGNTSDALPNGICHAVAGKNSAGKLKDDGKNTGLLDRKRLGANTRRVPVCQACSGTV